MITKWYSNIKNEEERERFVRSVLGSKMALNRLLEILDDEEKKLDRSETDISTYEQPNWAARQAHKNGYRSCLSMLKKLIDLDQKE
jgi:hypothetical protein